MPYKSESQRRKFRVLLERGEVSPATVEEFDRASEGKKLPERAQPTRRKNVSGNRTSPSTVKDH